MTDKLLMIAFYFPPSAAVSGALRPLSMARHLPDFGIEPLVMAPHSRAYSSLDPATLTMVPAQCAIERTFAFDVRRHLGIRGHYWPWLALPDRWSSWWLGAVPRGLRLIERYRPRAIWSTCPIATAHLIAASLHRRTGVPWIADFRDPLVPSGEEGRRSLVSRSRAWVERMTVREADVCVFVTQGARSLYEQRYSGVEHGAFEVIPNGFDEDGFSGFGASGGLAPSAFGKAPMLLLHSGVLYPQGRNPEAFFKALSTLLRAGRLATNDIRVVLRASGAESYYSDMLRRYGLGRIVELAPAVSREAALEEQYRADGLLLFQGRDFNSQVPAKIYEYFRVGRPVLGLVDEAGDTAHLIKSEGVGLTAAIDDSEAIAERLVEFIAGLRGNAFRRLEGDALAKYSRREGARQLFDLIARVSPV